jgi:hypothetical protein
MQNYFEIFGLSPRFGIDDTNLYRQYIEFQVECSKNDDIVKMYDVNLAYDVLSDAIKRGFYILKIFGINDRSIKLPGGFLEKVFELSIEYENGSVTEYQKNFVESESGDLIAKMNECGKITEENINDFAVCFIMYSYYAKFLNV